MKKYVKIFLCLLFMKYVCLFFFSVITIIFFKGEGDVVTSSYKHLTYVLLIMHHMVLLSL